MKFIVNCWYKLYPEIQALIAVLSAFAFSLLLAYLVTH